MVLNGERSMAAWKGNESSAGRESAGEGAQADREGPKGGIWGEVDESIRREGLVFKRAPGCLEKRLGGSAPAPFLLGGRSHPEVGEELLRPRGYTRGPGTQAGLLRTSPGLPAACHVYSEGRSDCQSGGESSAF